MSCHNLNIRVPEQMSITGFDNIGWATIGGASLTTVDQNFSLIGETIAKIMLQEDYVPKQYAMPVRLVPRGSSGKFMD
jgi:DNA-binding LacI/PurR family transcriptional regulator